MSNRTVGGDDTIIIWIMVVVVFVVVYNSNSKRPNVEEPPLICTEVEYSEPLALDTNSETRSLVPSILLEQRNTEEN